MGAKYSITATMRVVLTSNNLTEVAKFGLCISLKG